MYIHNQYKNASGWGNSHKKVEDARQKIWMKPLKEMDMLVINIAIVMLFLCLPVRSFLFALSASSCLLNEPIQKINVGVARALFDPKKIPL